MQEEAARAYDAAVRRYRGAKAVTNFSCMGNPTTANPALPESVPVLAGGGNSSAALAAVLTAALAGHQSSADMGPAGAALGRALTEAAGQAVGLVDKTGPHRAGAARAATSADAEGGEAGAEADGVFFTADAAVWLADDADVTMEEAAQDHAGTTMGTGRTPASALPPGGGSVGDVGVNGFQDGALLAGREADGGDAVLAPVGEYQLMMMWE